MKRRANISIATLLTLSLTVYGPLGASAGTGAGDSTGDPRAAPVQENFSEDELDELLAPIALYPDPLLAQILPASTFAEQLDEASRMLGGRVNENLIEKQNWDVRVKAIAHYPQVLQMMTQDKNWTIALGQAVASQSTDVMKAVQRLRADAKEAGNLASNDKMTVTEESQMISIEPAQPQVIYVPQYNPSVVYADRGVSTGGVVAASLISFGTGFVIGSWLNRRMWWGWGFPYHGWVGGGWIARSRPFVNTRNNLYVNNRYRNLGVNRNVLRRDISGYRGSLRRDAISHRQRYGRDRLGRPSDFRRPVMDTQGLRRPTGRPSDIRRPGRDTQGLRRPMGRPTDIRRPGMGARDMPRTRGGARDIRRPQGSRQTPGFGGYDRNRNVRMRGHQGGGRPQQMHRGGFGGARMNRGGGARMNRGGFGGSGRRGGFGGGRGRRH